MQKAKKLKETEETQLARLREAAKRAEVTQDEREFERAFQK